MVRKKGSLILCGAFLFVVWNALLLLYLWGRPPSGHLGEGGGAEPGGKEEWGLGRGTGGRTNLAGEVIRLAEEVEVQLETQKKLIEEIESHRAKWVRQKDVGKREAGHDKEVGNQPARTPLPPVVGVADQAQTELNPTGKPVQSKASDPRPQPDIRIKPEGGVTTLATPPEVVIPILVIACDRVTVRRSLDRLIQYRPSSELHPIVISQDCGHAETARVIGSYGDQVTHIRQPDLSDIKVRPEHRKFQGYYKISRHYRWALNQVFNVLSYSAVVIVEDDLEVGSGSIQVIGFHPNDLDLDPECRRAFKQEEPVGVCVMCVSCSSRWPQTFSSISEPCTRSCARTPASGAFPRGTTTAEMLWWIRGKRTSCTGQISSPGSAGCS